MLRSKITTGFTIAVLSFGLLGSHLACGDWNPDVTQTFYFTLDPDAYPAGQQPSPSPSPGSRCGSKNIGVSSIHLNFDDRLLAVGFNDNNSGDDCSTTTGHVQIFSVNDGGQATLIANLHEVETSVASVRFSPDNILLATGWSDGKIRAYNSSDNFQQFTLHNEPYGITSLDFNHDGTELAFSGHFGAKVLMVKSRQPRVLEGYGSSGDRSIYTVAYNSNGQWLAIGGSEERILVYNATSIYPVYKLNLAGKSESVLGMAFQPGRNNTLVVAESGRQMPIFNLDANTTHPAHILESDLLGVGGYNVDFSHDGNVLAAGLIASQAAVLLFNLTGSHWENSADPYQLDESSKYHGDIVTFSHNRNLLVVGNRNGTVLIFRIGAVTCQATGTSAPCPSGSSQAEDSTQILMSSTEIATTFTLSMSPSPTGTGATGSAHALAGTGSMLMLMLLFAYGLL